MKKIFIFLFSVFILTGFASCKKTESSGSSGVKKVFVPSLDTEKEVSLNVIGVYGNFEALEEVFEDFNKVYPKVSLSYEYVSDMENILENRCASGENVDIIFLISREFDSYYSRISEKYFVDLNAADVDLSAIGKKYIDATNVNGIQKFMPMYLMSTGLLVNETFLKKHKLELPKTRGQFETVCEALLAEGITPVYTNSEAIGLLFSNHIFSLIKKSDESAIKAIEQNEESAVSVLGEYFDDSLKLYNQWKEKKYFDFSGNTLPDHYESIIYRFLEGDIPFMLANSDTVSGLKKRELKSAAFKKSPFKYTYIPSPTGENSSDCVLFPIMFFSLCNTSKNLDYATEFMRFLATENSLKTMTAVKGMPSVYNTSGDSRLIHIDELSDDEVYVVGENGLSRKTATALYYSCLKFDEADGNTAALSDLFGSIVYKTVD